MFRITEDPSSGSLVQCLAKNYKIFKSAPTCFGSQRIHHQGALYSDWLKIIKYLKVLQHVSDHRGSIIREPCTVIG